jgi:hypothetical protein
MEKPSEKNLVKMRNWAEKFAEKSGTYLHPDHSVTDVVVEGLARYIEQVGRPLPLDWAAATGRLEIEGNRTQAFLFNTLFQGI